MSFFESPRQKTMSLIPFYFPFISLIIEKLVFVEFGRNGRKGGELGDSLKNLLSLTNSDY